MKYVSMALTIMTIWIVSGFLLVHGMPPGILWGTFGGTIVVGIAFNPEAFE